MNWIDILTGITLVGLSYALYRAQERSDALEKIISMVAAENDLLSKKHEQLAEYYNKEAQAFEKTIEDLDDRNVSLVSELSVLYKESINLRQEISSLKEKHPEDIKKARDEALTKSRAVMRGQATEHLAPYIIKGTNPKDYRFMGNPIDYVIFEGLSDVIDGEADAIKSITFLDIKTGKSNLNKSQRRIRDAITSNLVTFKVLNLDELVEKETIKDELNISTEERPDEDSSS